LENKIAILLDESNQNKNCVGADYVVLIQYRIPKKSVSSVGIDDYSDDGGWASKFICKFDKKTYNPSEDRTPRQSHDTREIRTSSGLCPDGLLTSGLQPDQFCFSYIKSKSGNDEIDFHISSTVWLCLIVFSKENLNWKFYRQRLYYSSKKRNKKMRSGELEKEKVGEHSKHNFTKLSNVSAVKPTFLINTIEKTISSTQNQQSEQNSDAVISSRSGRRPEVRGEAKPRSVTTESTFTDASYNSIGLFQPNKTMNKKEGELIKQNRKLKGELQKQKKINAQQFEKQKQLKILLDKQCRSQTELYKYLKIIEYERELLNLIEGDQQGGQLEELLKKTFERTRNRIEKKYISGQISQNVINLDSLMSFEYGFNLTILNNADFKIDTSFFFNNVCLFIYPKNVLVCISDLAQLNPPTNDQLEKNDKYIMCSEFSLCSTQNSAEAQGSSYFTNQNKRNKVEFKVEFNWPDIKSLNDGDYIFQVILNKMFVVFFSWTKNINTC
jgi:hypothetical protein